MAYDRLAKYATTWAGEGTDASPLVVTYHSTVIVRVDDDTVTLDSGGKLGNWHTQPCSDMSVTTKKKMRQASLQFNLGYNVYVRGGDAYVTTKAGDFRWADYAIGNRFRFDRHTGYPFSLLADRPIGYGTNYNARSF